MSKIINAIIIGLLGGGCFSAGVYYATLEFENELNVWDSNYQIITDKVYAFEEVSDPKTIRLYVKELNKILDDITFLGKMVESGQLADESLTGFFKTYQNKLDDVNNRILELSTQHNELEYKLKEQVTRLTGETDDNLELIDANKKAVLEEVGRMYDRIDSMYKDLEDISKNMEKIKNSKLAKYLN